jgi:hypothetical protein
MSTHPNRTTKTGLKPPGTKRPARKACGLQRLAES